MRGQLHRGEYIGNPLESVVTLQAKRTVNNLHDELHNKTTYTILNAILNEVGTKRVGIIIFKIFSLSLSLTFRDESLSVVSKALCSTDSLKFYVPSLISNAR